MSPLLLALLVAFGPAPAPEPEPEAIPKPLPGPFDPPTPEEKALREAPRPGGPSTPGDAGPAGLVVAGGVRISVLRGEAADISEEVGFGGGLRLERELDDWPVALFLGGDHDVHSRELKVQVPGEGGAAAPTSVLRDQRQSVTSFLVGAAWIPRLGRVRPRLGLAAGAALAFFKHPAAEPKSVTQWRFLGRVEGGTEVEVAKGFMIGLIGEWNALLPAGDDSLDLGDGRGPRKRALFDPYLVASLRASYAF